MSDDLTFWQKLKQNKGREPIMVLAPMADVTDPAFRRIIAKYGKPDVTWTEFVSADGLFLSPVGEYCNQLIEGKISLEEFKKIISNGVAGGDLIKDLAYSEAERPIVAQFFTSKPEMMRKASELAVVLGFDGVDINMGCPDKSVEKQGAGAGLIKNPELAKEIILVAKEGVRMAIENRKIVDRELDSGKEKTKEELEIPVSVKTRIGYNKDELETWLPSLLSTNPAVVTVHARTRKEMSLVPARWEHVKRAVAIRDEYFNNLENNVPQNERTLIFGNGDALDLEHGKKLALETGCDGIMFGRAIFGTPWLFSNNFEVTKEIKLNILVEHTKLFEDLCSHKSFAVMKKHFKAYVNGFDGARELRMELMECNNAGEVEMVINKYLGNI